MLRLRKLFKRITSFTLSVCIILSLFISLSSIVEGKNDITKYTDEFVNDNGTFNVEKKDFPENYVFDMTSLSNSLTATTKGFYVAVPKKVFIAIKNCEHTVTLIDALGTEHIYNPSDISDNIEQLTESTFNLGTLYRKSSSYASVAKKIAADYEMNNDDDSYKAWDNFMFIQAVSGGKAVKSCNIKFLPDCKNDMAGSTDSSSGADSEYFYNLAKKSSLYVYEYLSNSLSSRECKSAKFSDDGKIIIERNNQFTTDDTGNKQYFIVDRKMQKSGSDGYVAWSDSFLNNGNFNSNAVGFPQNYTFDFSNQQTVNTYCKGIKKEFFYAAKRSGRTVSVKDSIGSIYIIKSEDINQIDSSEFNLIVPFGSRFRNGSSYIDIAKTIANQNVGISKDKYNIKENFGFLEVMTGNGIINDCTISFMMDFGDNSTENAVNFYKKAVENSVYVYQYSNYSLTERTTYMAVAEDQPYLSIKKSEAPSMQFLISNINIRDKFVPVTVAAYDKKFVSDGKFNVDLKDFPSEYTFTFSSFGTSNFGYSRDLFNAIKDSGRKVTLIDRFGIKYVIDGKKISSADLIDINKLFQLQSIYKNSGSYQTVMSKIAAEGNIENGFFLNEDWLILDVQPTTNVNAAVNNSLPLTTEISLKLDGGFSGSVGEKIAQTFADYARNGQLLIYTYDKSNDVQNIIEDIAPIKPQVSEDNVITFGVQTPCTLIFSYKDLIKGRTEKEEHNPYEMVLRKDGKVISDGYSIEIGERIFIDLFMNEGRLLKHTYNWVVEGPGKDNIKLTPAVDSKGECMEINTVKATDDVFKIIVYVDNDKNNYVSTGNITVTYSVYGDEFLINGKFNKDAENFPDNLIFNMTAKKYMLTNEFLNAVYENGKNVTVIDSSGISYLIDQTKLQPIPKDKWKEKYPIKALYKDSDSYQQVMMVIAYQNDYLSFKLNDDYQIVDFQANSVTFPTTVKAQFKLRSKNNDTALAEKYSKLMQSGKLHAYEYSKKKNQIISKINDISYDKSTGNLTMNVDKPMTVVFTDKNLMFENDSSNNQNDNSDDNLIVSTGDHTNPYLIFFIALLSLGGIVSSYKQKHLYSK